MNVCTVMVYIHSVQLASSADILDKKGRDKTVCMSTLRQRGARAGILKARTDTLVSLFFLYVNNPK